MRIIVPNPVCNGVMEGRPEPTLFRYLPARVFGDVVLRRRAHFEARLPPEADEPWPIRALEGGLSMRHLGPMGRSGEWDLPGRQESLRP
jgi:hypothetical protein